MDRIETNESMINNLIKYGYLSGEEIIDAFRNIKRENFIPDEYKEIAYENIPLPIGQEQTISQPLVVSFMLKLLNAKSENLILEIGAGSGWMTSLLAYIVSKPQRSNNSNNEIDNRGKIIAIERLHSLYKIAKTNIEKYSFISDGTVSLIEGSGYKGYEKLSPYDRIISSAFVEKIPKEWKEQLKIGGRIVAPVLDNIVMLEKTKKNDFIYKNFPGFSFVPLVKKEENKK